MSVIVYDYGETGSTQGAGGCCCGTPDNPTYVSIGFQNSLSSARPGDRIIVAYFSNAFDSVYTVGGFVTNFTPLYSDGNTPGWRWWISNLDNTPGGAPVNENTIFIVNQAALYAQAFAWAIRGCKSSPFESYTTSTVVVGNIATITTINNSSCVIGVNYPSVRNNSQYDGILQTNFPKFNYLSNGIYSYYHSADGASTQHASSFFIPNIGNATTVSGGIDYDYANGHASTNVDYMIISAEPTNTLTIFTD